MMRTPVKQLSALLIGLVLSGCGPSVPNCDDPGVREDVGGMVEDHYNNDPEIALAGATVADLKDIRTLEVQKSGERKCSAQVTVIPSTRSPKPIADMEKPIIYHLAPGKDGTSYSILLDWP